MLLADILPADMLPETVSEDKVPTEVTLGCDAVVSVPAIPPDTVSEVKVPVEVILGCAAVVNVPVMPPLTDNVLRVPTAVMLGCDAVTICPESVVAITPPVVMLLLTVRLDKTPISLMLGCAAVVKVPEICPVATLPADTGPVTDNDPRVPNDVIAGWDPCVTTPAANANAGTLLSKNVKLASNSFKGMMPVCVAKTKGTLILVSFIPVCSVAGTTDIY